MDQNSTRADSTNVAAQAFADLRAEISLLRRGVERLTDERGSTPDYAPTLEAIGKRLEDVCVWARRVAERPAMQLTPKTFATEMVAASAESRARDKQILDHAASDLTAAGGRIDAMIARSRSTAEQNRELARNRIAFAVAGMLLFAILPGAIARSFPVSWAMPERIAARMLGLPMWNAGEDMMAKADPVRWRRIVGRERASVAPRK